MRAVGTARPSRPLLTRGQEIGYARPVPHTAQRPAWTCAACARPWPCHAARAQLRHGADSVQLATMMVGWLYEAAADLPGVPPSELWDRFIAWTRQ